MKVPMIPPPAHHPELAPPTKLDFLPQARLSRPHPHLQRPDLPLKWLPDRPTPPSSPQKQRKHSWRTAQGPEDRTHRFQLKLAHPRVIDL